MQPFQYEQERDHYARAARAIRGSADTKGVVRAMVTRSMRLLLPWTAVVVVSSTLAYALDHALVDASRNSSDRSEVTVASPGAPSNPLLIDIRPSALESCLSAWRYVSAERPEIYAAGLEQFLASGCVGTIQ